MWKKWNDPLLWIENNNERVRPWRALTQTDRWLLAFDRRTLFSRAQLYEIIMSHKLWVISRTVYFPLPPSWVIDYESTRGPYIFRVLDASCQGPYILADRIFFVKGPYIFSQRTVYFQNLRTVYFRGPYILRQRTVYFSQKDRIFSVSIVLFTYDSPIQQY